MHAQNQCTKGPIRLDVQSGANFKGGANLLANFSMGGRRAFTPTMIRLFVFIRGHQKTAVAEI